MLDIDHWVGRFLFLLLAVSALILLLIIIFLFVESWPALSNNGLTSFFNADGWFPLEGKLGLLPMLWASLAITVGAVLIAFPLGLACGIFVSYYSPSIITKPFLAIVALLAGIPSVVFGLWGLTELVPLVNQWQAPGASLFTGMIVLSLMILPTVVLTSKSALLALPLELSHNAAALALSKKTTITKVLVPAAWRGIAGGLLLSIVRALGETMAVLMVAGNVVQIPSGLFEPVRVLTANIALEMAYATDNHRAALFVSGLLLMLLVFFIAWISARINPPALEAA